MLRKIFKPNIQKLKESRNAQGLIRAIVDYEDARDLVSRQIHTDALEALVEIGIKETVNLIEKDNSGNARYTLNVVKQRIKQNIADTSAPRSIPQKDLESKWEDVNRCLSFSYEGKYEHTGLLRSRWGSGEIQGKKCVNCFHPAVITIDGKYGVYVGNTIDFYNPIVSLCLFCGELGRND